MPMRVETISRLQDGVSWLGYVLTDTDSRSRFEVWPTRGFLGVSWQETRPGADEESELLFADPSRPLLQQGIPLLFPFPNRIRDGRFTWQGRDWELARNDPSGCHAIHGLIHDQPWQVDHAGVTGDGMPEIAATLTSDDLPPERQRAWPGRYLLTARYRLGARQLEFHLAVTNLGSAPLPMGVGLHPYWRLPPATTRVELTAGTAQAWELHDCLPTGQLRPLNDLERIIMDPAAGPVGERHFDHLFRLTPPREKRRILWRLIAPERGGILQMSTSPSFRDFVLFTPEHRHALCLEPYTCVTDAINLHSKIWDSAKLIVLDPGAQWRGWVRWHWEWFEQGEAGGSE